MSSCSDSHVPTATLAGSVRDLITLRLHSDRRPLLADTLAITEIFRHRMLGTARRRFGPDAIPPRLLGRRLDGRPLAHQHQHAHFLGYADDGCEIGRLVVWCPGGLSAEEADVVRATTLPRVLGAAIHLESTEDGSPTPAQRWKSHTPFLPARHQKRRAGRLVPSLEEQILEELEHRGLAAPRRVEALAGPWTAFRTVRRERDGSTPALGAHGFTIELESDERGPLCLGRNSHFGMGLFVPVG